MSQATPRAPRYNIGQMTVIYDTGEGFWSAPVIDVSESGLFIETHHELPVGVRVTILLPDLPDDEPLPFEIQAEVVRVHEYDVDNHFDRTPGLAFRFVDMAPEDVEAVRTFLVGRGVPLRR